MNYRISEDGIQFMSKIYDRNYQMKLFVNEHKEVSDYSTVNLGEQKLDTV